MSGKRNAMDVLMGRPKLPAKEQAKLLRTVRKEAKAILEETSGRVHIFQTHPNKWTCKLCNSITHQGISTQEVSEFIKGYRLGLTVKLSPEERKAIAAICTKLGQVLKGGAT